jgi:hypothetical protein
VIAMASATRAMSRFALVLGVVTATFVPTAAAQRIQFRANVVSWSPNIVRPGEPVSIVLTLHAEPAQGAEIRADGRRDVAVVIRGNGQTRRFATTPLGSGLYRTEIVFPAAGSWHIRVRYRVGADGPVGETDLGKGGACVGDCVDAEAQQLRGPPSTGHSFGIAIAVGVVLMAVVLAAAAARRRGMAFNLRRDG